mgnify:CR=1 FL=1
MAMGILGQLVNSAGTQTVTVYTVSSVKVAVFNIFATGLSSDQYGSVYINNARVITTSGGVVNSTEIKSIIGDAGTTVQFERCTGIVTGYEEDA